MVQYQSSAELKNTAREMLRGKYGTSMLAYVIVKLAPILLGLPFITIVTVILATESIVNNTPLNENLLSITESIILLPCNILCGVFRAGLALFYLNIACRKRHSISDLFFGFRWQFKKALVLSAVSVALYTVSMLPYHILVYRAQIPFVTQEVVGILIAYCVGLLVHIPITLMISQVFYLLLDFPQLSAKQLLQQSIRIMRGHKKRLLYIQLSFLPLELLCICSFFIGYLWLIPYQNMTYTLFFLDLMNPRKAVVSQENQTD